MEKSSVIFMLPETKNLPGSITMKGMGLFLDLELPQAS